MHVLQQWTWFQIILGGLVFVAASSAFAFWPIKHRAELPPRRQTTAAIIFGSVANGIGGSTRG